MRLRATIESAVSRAKRGRLLCLADAHQERQEGGYTQPATEALDHGGAVDHVAAGPGRSGHVAQIRDGLGSAQNPQGSEQTPAGGELSTQQRSQDRQQGADGDADQPELSESQPGSF